MTNGDGVLIPLRARDGSIRAYAIVDAADAEWVNRWRWSLSTGYAVRNATIAPGQHFILGMHREILGLGQGGEIEVDHINRDRLDNRRANLRAIPKAGNRQNVAGRPDASSRFRGVSWRPTLGKWVAYTHVAGKYRHLGSFADEHEAAVAARAARRALMAYTVEQGAVAS